MNNNDSVFHDNLVRSLRSSNLEFKRLMGIIKQHNEFTTQWWNNINERNKIFFDCAQTMRSSIADNITIIQSTENIKNMHVHKIIMPIEGKPNEFLYKTLLTSAAEFQIITEDFVIEAVNFLQGKGNSLSHFESEYIKAKTVLNILLDACNCLMQELDDKNIPYNEKPITLVEDPVPFKNTGFDIDNVLSEFESASNPVNSNNSSNLSSISDNKPLDNITTTDYDIPSVEDILSPSTTNYSVEYDEYIPVSSPSFNNDNNNNNINNIVDEIDNIIAQVTPNTQTSNDRGNNIKRGNRGNRGNRGVRGSPRGSPRGKNNMRGNRGSPRGIPRGNRGIGNRSNTRRAVPQRNQPRTSVVDVPESLEEFHNEIIKLADQVQDILFKSNIEDMGGCELATKFVPTAKNLLTQAVNMENHLKNIGSNQVARNIKKSVLAYIHLCNEYFLQDINEDQKSNILETKQELKDIILSASQNKVTKPLRISQNEEQNIDISCFTNSLLKKESTNEHLNDPKRSNTVGTDKKPTRITMFETAAVPRDRAPSFGRNSSLLGGARRATTVESTNSDIPKALPREEQRKRAVEEIFQSEKVYLNTLQRLIWMYKKPLEATKDTIITDNEVRAIFSNIEMIFQLNKKLIRDLERTKRTERTIGDVFLEHATTMKLYSLYINNYDNSAQTLEKCKNKSVFRNLIEEYNTLANGGTMDLSAYLIQPVQRLPRYEMLIGAVVKLTDDGHPEKEKLIEAKKKIKLINDAVNESKRRTEMKQEVSIVKQKLQEKPPNLVILKPNRTLITKSFIQRIENYKTRKTEKRIVYLFNDSILVAKIRGEYPANYTLKYKTFIIPNFCLNVEISQELPNALYMSWTENGESIEEIWQFNNDTIRDEWITNIEKLRDTRSKKL